MWRGGEAGITELTSAVSAASPSPASVLLCLLRLRYSPGRQEVEISSHTFTWQLVWVT